MRKKIVAGNWKMNGSLELVNNLLPRLVEVSEETQAQILVCPPAPYLTQAQALAGDKVAVGAQNCSEQASGAFTGEVSVSMLTELGMSHVLIGHSERRAIYSETDALVVAKVKAAVEAGLVAVLCVGETLEQREAGHTLGVVLGQIKVVLDELTVEQWSQLVVAYEPVWAIGTGKTATSAQAQDVHQAIRQQLAGYDVQQAEAVSILYGGSVKASNAGELFAQPDIDGALVGGASLVAEEFISICRQAD
ncbi:triose-phosphate isomerase [Oceanospirillum beijerinckii]|uniref:triose-phosphate isomerase n=1 Tax=Oceanospirillum beijerinckii TaxID=64976 RepID=UPI00041B7AC9|nr:triose-phosphate isomerase [Oceanospirillum beijerinckii]